MVVFERTTYKQGDSLVITIPPELQTYLDITEKTTIQLQPERGKKGNYITLWKKKVNEK